jgi:hypothetical protein
MKISRIIIAFLIILNLSEAKAQLVLGGHFYGEEAFKFSEVKNTGSARMQSLGGAYTALGADATNAAYNPAGLGFYNRSELSITPIFNSVRNSSNYIDSRTKLNTSNANIGQLGLIMSSEGTGTRKKRSTIAITYSKQVNFNNDFSYSGQNKRSSMMDYFAERATQRGASSQVLDDEYDPSTGTSTTSTSMYYQTFMIDPSANGGTPYTKVEPSLPVNQSGNYTTTGSTSQWSIGYGANFDDKTYVGFSVGFMRVNYEYIGNHTERFTSGRFFNAFEFNDDLITRGSGINVSLGGIRRLTENITLGVNIASPSFLSLSETYNSNILIDNKNTITTSNKQVATIPSDFEYNITTPLRISGGGAFFFNDKKGFVALDAEYVGYKNMGVKDPNDSQWSSDQKRAIQNVYKNVVNLKAGAEYRINNVRARAGLKYQADPYAQKVNNLDKSQLLVSAGVGYRSAKFFIDFAGVFNSFNTSYTPYELNNPQNYASASISASRNSFVVSVGTFF